MKVLIALVGATSLLLLSNNPSLAQSVQKQAQGGLCRVCQPFGGTCCALRPSIAACISCGVSVGYNRADQEDWCRLYQPRCARKR